MQPSLLFPGYKSHFVKYLAGLASKRTMDVKQILACNLILKSSIERYQLSEK